MSANNRWLHAQLIQIAPNDVEAQCEPLIIARLQGKNYRIYVPSPHEYIVSIDVVDKVLDLGGNTISFARSWCRPSLEAQKYAQEKGLEIIPHGALLARFENGKD